MLTLIERTLVYLGDMFPLFLIAFIQSASDSLKLETLVFFVIIVISGFCTIYWMVIIGKNQSREKNSTILEIDDRGTTYVVYLITYFSLVPLFVNQSWSGLLSFSIFLTIVYSVYINSEIVFFNPFLALFGFKLYHAKVEGKGNTYIITESRNLHIGDEITIMGITDYLYKCERVDED